jgi:hypothetical protein
VPDSTENESRPLPKGIPPDHPSIGKHVREPVEGPSWPQAPDHGGGRMITPALETIWSIALGVWVLYSRLAFVSPFFRDPDSAKVAFGVAQRLQGTPYSEGVFYQIEKQAGSYFIFEWLARLYGVNAAGLEHFLSAVCACFMIGIIVLSFYLGMMIWGRRVALVSTTLLSISPMMWLTGEYITSLVPALFFFMLAVWAMVMSYRVKGGRWWLVASGLLFAWATLVRLDMLLGILVPICYAMSVDRRGLRRALILYAIWTLTLLVAWFLVFHFNFAEIFHISQPHRPDYPDSLLLNWWGMGPFLFVFAFAGFVYRFATDRRPLPFIFFWILGFNTFYTGHLYSPRYFIPYYPVVGWLAAFSIIALYTWLVKAVRYNRVMRLIFIVLFATASLTMLTTAINKYGDRGVRIEWGKTITYARNDGLNPTGSAWFFMQDFRKGTGFQYTWIEKGAQDAAIRLFDPNSSGFVGSDSPPIYVGSESEVFLNYFLLTTGWSCRGERGEFVTFTREDIFSSEDAPDLLMQTAYVGEKRVPEYAFLSDARQGNIFLGRESMARLISQDSETESPTLSPASGWHVFSSAYGLDILAPGLGGGVSDGTLEVERSLFRFFNRYPLARYHVEFSDTRDETPLEYGGRLISHDGDLGRGYYTPMIRGAKNASWECIVEPGQWLALAVNRFGINYNYQIFVNDELLTDDAITLDHDLEGFGLSRWDIFLIPPWLFNSDHARFSFKSELPADLLDIVVAQRNYPDSQYRDSVAIPNGLEFSEIECWR